MPTLVKRTSLLPVMLNVKEILDQEKTLLERMASCMCFLVFYCMYSKNLFFSIIDGLFDHLLVHINIICFSIFLCRSFLLVVPMSTLSFTMKTQVPLQIHSQTHRYKGLCVLCILTLYNFHFV